MEMQELLERGMRSNLDTPNKWVLCANRHEHTDTAGLPAVFDGTEDIFDFKELAAKAHERMTGDGWNNLHHWVVYVTGCTPMLLAVIDGLFCLDYSDMQSISFMHYDNASGEYRQQYIIG